jgi:hypothetical protein
VYSPPRRETIASAGEKFDLEQVLKVDYTQAVLATDRPVIVDPRQSLTQGVGFSFFGAAPVKDKSTNKTVALVRTRASMTVVNDFLSGSETNLGRDFYLTDSQGNITASSNPKLLQKKLADIFPKLSSQIKKAGKQSSPRSFLRKGRSKFSPTFPTRNCVEPMD